MGVITHGGTYTNIYRRWYSMICRCKPSWKHRKYYFDKGISVCEEWQSFESFRSWALNNGFQKHLELDRRDNEKGYSPTNCRFITRRMNSLNTSKTIIVNYLGLDIPLTILCDKLDIHEKYELIRSRLKRGWDLDIALTTVASKNKPVLDKETGKIFESLKQASDFVKMPEYRLSRMLNGKVRNKTSLTYNVNY